MKRLWISCVATVTTAALMSSAVAQSNAPIGSYQSILSKAGYAGNGSNWGSYNEPGPYGSAYRTAPQDQAAPGADIAGQAVPDAAAARFRMRQRAVPAMWHLERWFKVGPLATEVPTAIPIVCLAAFAIGQRTVALAA